MERTGGDTEGEGKEQTRTRASDTTIFSAGDGEGTTAAVTASREVPPPRASRAWECRARGSCVLKSPRAPALPRGLPKAHRVSALPTTRSSAARAARS